MQFTCGRRFNSFTGIVGVPPALSAKREKALSETNYPPGAVRAGPPAIQYEVTAENQTALLVTKNPALFPTPGPQVRALNSP